MVQNIEVTGNAERSPITPASEITVTLNGNLVQFDQPPIIEGGRTLVPLRAIFEALGATVDWNGSTQTVTAVKDDLTVTLKIGSNILTKNGVNIMLDVPAKIVNGRTLVPARAVAEAFGAKVDWDAKTQTVIITASDSSQTPDAKAVINVGDIIQFGKYDWRVLDVQDGKALIISEYVIERRNYSVSETDATWETRDLRKYLNGEFYHWFSMSEKAKIAQTKITNNNNPWYGTKGGNDTTDRIFLLSIEEVVKYFGDSGQLMDRQPEQWVIHDQYSEARFADYLNIADIPDWWRSLGHLMGANLSLSCIFAANSTLPKLFDSKSIIIDRIL